MIRGGLLAEGDAPSYFIEGMLYNAPDDKFVGTYADMWVESFNYVATADRTSRLCANRLHWLVREGSPTSSTVTNFSTVTVAAKSYWES